MTGEFFNCPYCGRKVVRPADGSGDTTCPGCQIPVPVPDAPHREQSEAPQPSDAPPVAPPPGYFPPTPTMPSGVETFMTPQSQTEAEYKIRMIGIFNTIVGALSILASIFAGIAIFAMMAVPQDEIQRQLANNPNNVSLSTVIAVYAIPGILSLPAGIIELIGGIKLLKRSPNARGWGYASAITSIISLWLCCGVVLTAASGIYTLVVLADANVKSVLARIK